MQILGLLGVNFDAEVVTICTKVFSFLQIGPGHTVVTQLKENRVSLINHILYDAKKSQ